MQANRRRDTGPERAVRSALHRRGLRYRVDLPIRAPGGRPIRPDVVFPGARVALFVDGCFWHQCPEHGTTPATNQAYWIPKLKANRGRDAAHSARLEAEGWFVLRAWTHEDPEAVAERVEKAVAARK